MKVYRGLLVLILSLAVIGIVWYCFSVYSEQRSIDKGLLVWEENIDKEEAPYAGNGICEGCRELHCL